MCSRLLELDQNYKIIKYSNECVTEWPKTLLNNYHEEKGNKCFIKVKVDIFILLGINVPMKMIVLNMKNHQ